jgi:hypothetical protein
MCPSGACVPTSGCCGSSDCAPGAPANTVPTCGGNSQCSYPCNASSYLCNGACIANGTPCMGSCSDPTQHDCNNLCVPKTSTSACGPSCTSCFVPQNGGATCDGSSCGIVCNSGYKACNGACIPTSGCCADGECTMGGNNTVGKCVSNVCKYTCVANYKQCSSTGPCIPSADCCQDGDCTAGGTGTVGRCVSNQCQYPCANNYKQCTSGGACVPSTNCCTSSDCGQYAHATSTCGSNGACQYTCVPDTASSSWGNCNTSSPDCETDLTKVPNCGSCGETCQCLSGGGGTLNCIWNAPYTEWQCDTYTCD